MRAQEKVLIYFWCLFLLGGHTCDGGGLDTPSSVLWLLQVVLGGSGSQEFSLQNSCPALEHPHTSLAEGPNLSPHPLYFWKIEAKTRRLVAREPPRPSLGSYLLVAAVPETDSRGCQQRSHISAGHWVKP